MPMDRATLSKERGLRVKARGYRRDNKESSNAFQDVLAPCSQVLAILRISNSQCRATPIEDCGFW